jgi:UTP--glucose-1-phosphate uridylyltransferase
VTNPIDGALDPETRELLDRHGFDRVPFARLRDRLVREPDAWLPRVRGPVGPPPIESIAEMPRPDSAECRQLAATGRRAIEAGEVAAVVLNGGMATRFGGGAKGIVEPIAGRSFIDLKLSQISSAGQGRVPVLLMNSFATERATAEHLAHLAPNLEVRQFNQLIAPRLTPEGELFLDARGRCSPYAPGHGDLPEALVASGELERFVGRGGRVIVVANVDNLGAGLDPVIVGLHLERGRPMTVELVETRPGDAGGVPALVEGRLAIVEMFRMPAEFDPLSIPLLNTNNFVFDAAALADPPDLDWFPVRKQVDGRDAVQFERLLGQLSEHLEVGWLRVPRAGPRSRFVPFKVPADLERRAGELRQVLAAQGLLAGNGR